MAATAYSVTLHHLAPGAKAAGLAYPDEQLLNVTVPQLRELLIALAEVATHLTIYEPSGPEIRIKTDRDVFIIRTRYRRLCFVGWETILRGEEHSIGFILSTVTGNLELIKTAGPARVERTTTASPTRAATLPSVKTGGIPRWAKIATLAVFIIGINGFTAWMLLRPPPSLLPKHELLSESESRALLIRAAGTYATGAEPGARRIVIDPSGKLLLSKLNAQRAATEERTRQARGAKIGGLPTLISGDAVVQLKDADTVIMFGTTYRRLRR